MMKIRNKQIVVGTIIIPLLFLAACTSPAPLPHELTQEEQSMADRTPVFGQDVMRGFFGNVVSVSGDSFVVRINGEEHLYQSMLIKPSEAELEIGDFTVYTDALTLFSDRSETELFEINENLLYANLANESLLITDLSSLQEGSFVLVITDHDYVDYDEPSMLAYRIEQVVA